MAEERDSMRVASWGELFARTLELGLGAAALTAETAQRLVNDLVRRGEVSREEGQSLVDRLMHIGREQRQMLNDTVEKATERAMTRMDMARRSDVEALRRRVEELEAIVRGEAVTGEPYRAAHAGDQDTLVDQE